MVTCVTEQLRVAVNWPLRLFIKNTALCKHESGRIGCDACPVPEGYGEGLVRKGEALNLSPGKRRP